MMLQTLVKQGGNIGKLLLLGGLILCLGACSKGEDVQPTSTPESDYTGFAAQPSPGSVTANGVLVPVRQVALCFGVGGSRWGW